MTKEERDFLLVLARGTLRGDNDAVIATTARALLDSAARPAKEGRKPGGWFPPKDLEPKSEPEDLVTAISWTVMGLESCCESTVPITPTEAGRMARALNESMTKFRHQIHDAGAAAVDTEARQQTRDAESELKEVAESRRYWQKRASDAEERCAIRLCEQCGLEEAKVGYSCKMDGERHAHHEGLTTGLRDKADSDHKLRAAQERIEEALEYIAQYTNHPSFGAHFHEARRILSEGPK